MRITKRDVIDILLFTVIAGGILIALILFLRWRDARRDPGDNGIPKPSPRHTMATDSIQPQIKRYLKSRRDFRHVDVSLVMTDLTTGRDIVNLLPERDHMPASTVKILTAAAALDTLGTDYRYKTKFYHHNDHVIIQGAGDSFLRTPDLKNAAAAIKKNGIKKVAGVIYDDSLFQTQKYGLKDWNFARHLFAPPSALTLNYNAIDLTVRGTGKNIRVSKDPATRYAIVRYDLEKVPGFKPFHPRMELRKLRRRDLYKLSGKFSNWNLAYDYFHLGVSRPGLYAATVLAEKMRDAGIEVGKRLERGQAPADAKPLHIHSSPPLTDILAEMCKHSNNVVASNICFSLAAEAPGGATAAGGLAKIRGVLRKYGMDPRRFVLDDASGLSRKNSFKARDFCDFLFRCYYSPFREELLRSLSIQGKDRHSRKVKPPSHIDIREKSGTLSLTGVNTLAGYFFNRKTQKSYAFALFCRKTNGGRAYSGRYTNPILEALIRILDRKDEGKEKQP